MNNVNKIVDTIGNAFFKDSKDTDYGKNLPQLLRSRAKVCPDVTLQACKNRAGKFDRYSYKYVYERVIEFACALKNFGIKRGDKVAMMADNRREWLIADFALLCLGAADVPRGCDSMGAEMRFIINFVGCKVGFFENGKQLEKVLEKREEVPTLTDVILFDPPSQETDVKAHSLGIKVHLFSEFEDSGASASRSEKEAIEAEIDATDKDEIATVIFTSGTTGTPKGVMLTHDNYMAQVECARQVLPDARQGQLWLSVLPVWHSFERAFVYMIMGLNSGYAYSKPVAPVMLGDMAEIHPEWMCAVPRLWESFARAFYREVKKKGGFSLMSYNIAISIGKQYSWAKNHVRGLVCRFRNYPKIFDVAKGIIPFILLWLPNLLADLVVFRQLRKKLGGKMIAAISGGGTLPSDIDSFYHAIGFNLLEGYGMTETAPVLSVRNSHRPCYGCVGEVFPTMEMRIVEEKDGKIVSMDALPPGKRGMIMVRGRQTMKGYFNRPDLTEATIDKDGWLNTGDLGMMSFDNEIKITGRAKDTIVLQGGENIEPVLLESAIKASNFVESVVALGQDQKFIAALIVPDKALLLNYAEENGIVYDTYESLLETTEIQTLFRSEIDKYITPEAGFRTCERVFRFCLLPESFREGEEISAKKELLRHKIDKIYAKQIKKLFK